MDPIRSEIGQENEELVAKQESQSNQKKTA